MHQSKPRPKTSPTSDFNTLNPHTSGPLKSSRLATLQQFIALGGVLALLAWAWFTRDRSLPVMLALPMAMVILYGATLATEFISLRWMHGADPAPRAGGWALLRAWWQEFWCAPRVFLWNQPFRWRDLPDSDTAAAGAPTVVLVHGLVCNRGFWLPWMRVLRQRGIAYVSVSLEPVFGSIDAYVDTIDATVRQAVQLRGAPVVVVCHSMGGVALRAWRVATPDADALVERIVTIGTPHGGTWLGRLSTVTNGSQMALDSPWLRALSRRERERWPQDAYGRFVCWYANTDNIVFPASTGSLPGADNRLLTGKPHVAMAFSEEVMQGTLDLLDAPTGP